VINGGTNQTTTVSDPHASAPNGIAVNLVSNKIYVANYSSNNVTVIDGATNKTTTVAGPNEFGPYGIAVNALTNKTYVANQSSQNLTVIDGATNRAVTILDPNSAGRVVAFNPVNYKSYVAGSGAYVMADQQVQPIPVQVTIHRLPRNRTHNPKPVFTFSAKDNFKPNRTTVDNLLFQVDTWQGPWIEATSKGSGRYQGRVVIPLRVGVHILYAYATDGQDATSTNTGQQSSPLIGNIQAYSFLVY
jgi:YVTN family beta-propeller protein